MVIFEELSFTGTGQKLSPKRDFRRSLARQRRFHAAIPGGSHTYAKGDDQFPEFMPPYIVKGKGCRVWDLDDNEYIEYGAGLRSVTLGHAFAPVVKAATDQLRLGSNFGRPSVIELECAEQFLQLIDGAEMVKFCKNGSDAMDAAIRLSRAYTGRDLIGICMDHPFFSVGDWFIGRTPMGSGIPQSTRDLSLTFRYNDLKSVEEIFLKHPTQIACIVLEAQKYDIPDDNFLPGLQGLCQKHGAVLIFDEMITGFRWHLGGAQKKFNIVPDLSAWGKAMANGFSVAALAGKRELMDLGGIHHDRDRVFLLSATHGAETHELAAAMATMKFYENNEVIRKLDEQGQKLRTGFMKASGELGLQEKVKIVGPSCCSAYTTYDQANNPSQPFRTLFIQESLKRGILMPSTVISYSHTDDDIEETVEKIHEVLVVYSKALREGIDKFLEGRPVKPVWRKSN